MSRWFSRLALLAGVVAAAFVGAAGPAYRYAGFELGHSFKLMEWGVYAAAAAAVLAILWIIVSAVTRSMEGLMSFILALVLAIGAAYMPLNMRATAEKLPFIHDITTDTANPPAFVAIAPLRAAAPNGVDYKTDPTKQQSGYPDIQPLVTPDVAPADLFTRAEATAKAMGWEIVAAEAAEGRIEATDTTQWWGFKDDIIIRISAEGTGSRLDIRSMSRVGGSDLGKNAERIRAFLAKLKEAK
ncbi:MAG: DUF1499 domain-containing protein [Micropepsaceae bacterium]